MSTIKFTGYLWTDDLPTNGKQAWDAGIIYIPSQPERGIPCGRGSYFNSLAGMFKALQREAELTGVEVLPITEKMEA